MAINLACSKNDEQSTNQENCSEICREGKIWLILMTFQVFARAWAGAIQASSMLAGVTTIRGVLGCEAVALLMSAILREIRRKGVRVRHLSAEPGTNYCLEMESACQTVFEGAVDFRIVISEAFAITMSCCEILLSSLVSLSTRSCTVFPEISLTV